MPFKVIKASLDGLCGGESIYETIEEAANEVYCEKGWDTIKKLRKAICKWGQTAAAGEVFRTHASAIISLPVDPNYDHNICPQCGADDMQIDYGDIDAQEGERLVQTCRCLQCEAEWEDVFVLHHRRHIKP